jgi:hypothetical protein
VPRRLLSEIFCFHPTLFLFETCAAVSFFSLSQSIAQKAQTKWRGALASSKSSKLPLISFYSLYPALFNTFMCCTHNSPKVHALKPKYSIRLPPVNGLLVTCLYVLDSLLFLQTNERTESENKGKKMRRCKKTR